MVKVLADLPGHPEVVQPELGVTYASKIDKSEARLDFTQNAEQAERQIRAFAPAPGAFFELEGERYRVLAGDVVEAGGAPGAVLDSQLTIACCTGAIRPALIQRAGRPTMKTAELLRGRAIAPGNVLKF